jgi:hypothetical protein
MVVEISGDVALAAEKAFALYMDITLPGQLRRTICRTRHSLCNTRQASEGYGDPNAWPAEGIAAFSNRFAVGLRAAAYCLRSEFPVRGTGHDRVYGFR